ncbi:MAG: CoA transferase [Acetobacteraceae bacterium]|nr:CoA transferase [Acetobacteraceae bacterium]
MPAPLADLVVVEASGDVATRYCGKLFAAHGARVIQAHHPDNSRLAYGGASAPAYATWLDHGKELAGTLRADLAVDLVIAGQAPADVAAGETLAAALSGSPALLAVTWFGLSGPCAGWHGSDAIIQAMSGVAYPIGTPEGPPALPQGHAPQVVGGATGFIAAMAALIGRRHGHAARRIEVSILEAFMCLTEHSGPGAFAGAPASQRRGVNRYGPVYPQTIFPTGDGWIGVTALTPQQWQELCGLIGLPELAKDPRYETTDLRMAAADELDDILMPAVAKMAALAMLEEGQRRRVPLAPVPTMEQVLATPHWRARDSFQQYSANGSGFEGPAMPFRLHSSGAGATPAGGEGPSGPLAGIRVLDLSMGWSGPLAGRHFADLGAEVIKVEGCAHIDWWRGWNALEAGDPPPYEMKSNFNAVNRNKRAITLDLRHPTGVALLKQLAGDADLLIENYAPGVLTKLGLGPEELAAVNPRLSYISMGAFGSAGPWSGFRAYGSTTEQAAGMPWLHGEAHWAPAMQHTAYGDPIAGIYAACAGLVALYGRHETGGTRIDLSQVECLFQLAADAIIAQSATGTAPPRTGNRRATSLWTGAVRCAGADAWLAVDIATEAQLAALAQAIGEPTPASLAAWAASRDAGDAAAILQAQGIAAGPVTPGTSLLHDKHLVARGFWLEAERRHVGRHVVPRAPYILDGARPAFVCPTPTLGEHNAEVLGEVLGLPPAEIAALESAGIIGSKAI